MSDKRHSAKLNLNAGETAPCRVSGHFGHSGHQIGKLLYNGSIENFPKPLSYPSQVSSRILNSRQLRNPATATSEGDPIEFGSRQGGLHGCTDIRETRVRFPTGLEPARPKT